MNFGAKTSSEQTEMRSVARWLTADDSLFIILGWQIRTDQSIAYIAPFCHACFAKKHFFGRPMAIVFLSLYTLKGIEEVNMTTSFQRPRCSQWDGKNFFKLKVEGVPITNLRSTPYIRGRKANFPPFFPPFNISSFLSRQCTRRTLWRSGSSSTWPASPSSPSSSQQQGEILLFRQKKNMDSNPT